jgi:CRP-like cAMP-binding protein
MDVSDYALLLPYKDNTLESVESFKIRRNIGDLTELDLIRRHHNRDLVDHAHVADPIEVSVPRMSQSIQDTKMPKVVKIRNSLQIVEHGEATHLHPTEQVVDHTKAKMKKIESKIESCAPLLHAAKSLMDDHPNERVVEKLVALVRNRHKLKKNTPISTHSKYLRVETDYAIKEKEIQETRAQVQRLVENPQMDRVDSLLARIQLSTASSRPANVKKLFSDYEAKLRATRRVPSTEEIIKDLEQPAGTRSKDALVRINDFLHTSPVFKDKPGYVLEQLCDALVLETHSEGSTLFRQGDPGNKYYCILCGSVRLTVTKPGYVFTDLNAPQNFIAVMKAGEAFGDHALLNNLNRSTSAFANEENTLLLTIEKDTFVRCMSASYQVQLKERMNFLRKYSFTAKVDTKGLAMIAQKLFPRMYEPNSIIMEEGQLYDSVFFVRKGKCAVYRDLIIKDQKRRIYVGEMDHTQTFNEESVFRRSMNRKGSPFTVIAVDNVEINSIVSQGEWTKLNLHHTPHPLGLLTTPELMYQYRIRIHQKRFKEYQKKYIKQIKTSAD